MNGSMSLARSCCGHSSECLRGRAGGRDVKSRRVVAVGAVSRERSKGCLLFAHTLFGEPLRAERATEYRQRMCRRLPSTSLLCTARRAAEPLHVRAYLLKSVKETRSSLCSWRMLSEKRCSTALHRRCHPEERCRRRGCTAQAPSPIAQQPV